MKSKPTGSISPGHRRLLYVIGAGSWLSGGLWLLFHYFLVRQNEFGPAPHPLQSWWLKIHGAFAFAALWIFGLIWAVHISKALPRRARKRSGILLLSVILVLVVTGYLLYYVASDAVRPAISVVHWSVGLGSPVFLVLHRARGRRAKSRPVASFLPVPASNEGKRL